MHVVAITSRKGGSGKTTLAGHLAVQAERSGDGPVAVADLDPQGSLSDWWNARSDSTPGFLQVTVAKFRDELDRLSALGFKQLFLDMPPVLPVAVAELIRHVDLVVVPIRPSPHDLRSVGKTIDLVEGFDRPLVFVLNSATARSRIATEAISALSQHGAVAPVTVHNRVDFAASMVDGRTVMELPGSARSAKEISELWRYISDRLEGRVWSMNSSSETTPQFCEPAQGIGEQTVT